MAGDKKLHIGDFFVGNSTFGIFFWLGCLCWFIGICAYAVYAYRQTVIFTVFAILFLTIYWRVNMFSKIKELHKTYRKNQKETIVVDIHSLSQ
ncbi:hypothetical protein ABVY98_003782 [Escherichia coli]